MLFVMRFISPIPYLYCFTLCAPFFQFLIQIGEKPPPESVKTTPANGWPLRFLSGAEKSGGKIK